MSCVYRGKGPSPEGPPSNDGNGSHLWSTVLSVLSPAGIGTAVIHISQGSPRAGTGSKSRISI